ncbi:aldehyde dehydrogenase family protein, partial [Herbaspirillum lusitanum]|uniref:aldehyde dehydrogenase family protein n=1 Tax=Herbaspirillum lusitanum TaxID=213312 RepID=UPI00138971EC
MYPALNDERMAIDDYTSIVNERHFTRLQALLDDAREGGATVEKLTTHTPHPSTRLLPPMALTQVAPEARILQEEIFGPLLPLVTYEHLVSERE